MSIRNRRGRKGESGEEEINISPLIDMVFILLIFFIVTTVFVEETGVDVERPEATSAADLDKENINIAITRSGEVVYGDREIGVSGVAAVVRRLTQSEEKGVTIKADKAVTTDLLVRVIDEVNLAGAQSVSIATEGAP